MIQKLIGVRKQQKKKMIEIANAIGVSDTTFAKYEAEKTSPPLDKFIAWIGVLGYEMTITRKAEKL